jgi:hypothetical protein
MEASSSATPAVAELAEMYSQTGRKRKLARQLDARARRPLWGAGALTSAAVSADATASAHSYAAWI